MVGLSSSIVQFSIDRGVVSAAAGSSTGRGYVNFLSDPGEGRGGYDPAAYERLVALKREYDPTNVFRLNQNIAPEGS